MYWKRSNSHGQSVWLPFIKTNFIKIDFNKNYFNKSIKNNAIS